jgi:hypothetical protein
MTIPGLRLGCASHPQIGVNPGTASLHSTVPRCLGLALTMVLPGREASLCAGPHPGSS